MKLPTRPTSMIHECTLAGLLVCVLLAAAWLDPKFVALNTQLDLSSHAVELALLTLPVTLIIISGAIDLSVGSAMALSAVVLGISFEAGAPIAIACLAAVLTGTAAGALNGLFVARFRVEPLIVTLATLAAYRGLAEGLSLGKPVSGFPESFLGLASGTALGIPNPVVLFMVFAVLFAFTVWKSVPGFRVYALGDNERAARYAGIPIERVKLILFTMSGAAAGLAAVLFVARRNTAKADVGSGIELEVITAIILGGTSIFGGRGTIVGTLLGVALIHEVREFVSWYWQRDELILMVIGAILIGSVLLNNLASNRK